MILSIGMIVKNEEKFLRNCLTSMLPILQNVQSELIIFDTGSTDATVEIAREFTDHVYEIEWRGDFAWARNHTLDKATGEWYMYVDADEVFTDTSDLIAFFNTGEYKNYNCATYAWRNIHEENRVSYFRVTRLFKMENGMRFEGKIHETLPASQPVKKLESSADHFGYFDMKAKRIRNLQPMLELYEENPEDERNIFHIIASHKSSEASPEELDVMKKFLDIGLKLTGGDQEKIYHHVFNYLLVCYLDLREDLEGIVETVDKYMDGLKYTHIALLYMISSKASALHRLERYTEAAKAAEQGIELLDSFREGKMDLDISTIVSFDWNLYKSKQVWLNNILASYALAGDYLSTLKWADVFARDYPYALSGMPSIANTFMGALLQLQMFPNMESAEKMQLHEAAVRVGHKYLFAVYGPAVYRAGSVESLSATEAYIFYAGEAYASNDNGDTPAFVRGMQQALQFNPTLKDIAWLCVQDAYDNEMR